VERFKKNSQRWDNYCKSAASLKKYGSRSSGPADFETSKELRALIQGDVASTTGPVAQEMVAQ